MWCGVSTAEPRVWCEGSREEPRVWCEGSREEPGVCGVRGPQRSLVCVCGLGVSTAERRVWGVRGPQQSLVFGVRTLKSLLQHHSSKASILWHSAFFITLTCIHDYWKNHGFDQTDLCQQSNVSAF